MCQRHKPQHPHYLKMSPWGPLQRKFEKVKFLYTKIIIFVVRSRFTQKQHSVSNLLQRSRTAENSERGRNRGQVVPALWHPIVSLQFGRFQFLSLLMWLYAFAFSLIKGLSVVQSIFIEGLISPDDVIIFYSVLFFPPSFLLLFFLVIDCECQGLALPLALSYPTSCLCLSICLSVCLPVSLCVCVFARSQKI